MWVLFYLNLMNTSKISKVENTKNRILWRVGEKVPLERMRGGPRVTR